MAIALPPGVKIGPGRETSQTTSGGSVVQGMLFPLTTPAGSNTSVFIPYSEIHDEAKVEQAVTARVKNVIWISG